VLAIGPAGENLSRLACLMHDAGNSSGQGGFGAVWGAKQLKAISVIGSNGIKVHDAKGLMQARLSQTKQFAFELEGAKSPSAATVFDAAPLPMVLWGGRPGAGRPLENQRPQACVGCHSGCRGRYETGLGNEASCAASLFYPEARTLEIQRHASDLLNRYGINAFEMILGERYLRELNKRGVLGPGKAIDFPFGFENYGSKELLEQFVKMMAYGDDGNGNPHPIGRDLLQGFVRAAARWGRLEGPEGDFKTGLLHFPYWGNPNHYEARTELEWGYGFWGRP
jgi:aldehyde:ferredoxin oxidoreductase